MADDLLFPSGQAYSNLTGRAGVKLFAVDDTTNPQIPVPGFVVMQPASQTGNTPSQNNQSFTFDQD